MEMIMNELLFSEMQVWGFGELPVKLQKIIA